MKSVSAEDIDLTQNRWTVCCDDSLDNKMTSANAMRCSSCFCFRTQTLDQRLLLSTSGAIFPGNSSSFVNSEKQAIASMSSKFKRNYPVDNTYNLNKTLLTHLGGFRPRVAYKRKSLL